MFQGGGANNLDVVLAAGAMLVNGTPFSTAFSRKTRLLMAAHVHAQTHMGLGSEPRKAIKFCGQNGFPAKVIMMDNQFADLEAEVPMVETDAVVARERASKIETQHRSVKERAMAMASTLPHNQLPAQITINLTHMCVPCLNAFPRENGVSREWSPREMACKCALDFPTRFPADFGGLVEAHEDPEVTNAMRPRMHTGMCLGPTRNKRDTLKVCDVKTGRVKKLRKIDALPLPDDIIELTSQRGEKDNEQGRKKHLELPNRNVQTCGVDDEELAEDNEDIAALARMSGARPSLLAVFPGPDLERNLPGGTMAPTHGTSLQTNEEREHAARVNADLESRGPISAGASTAADSEVIEGREDPDDPNPEAQECKWELEWDETLVEMASDDEDEDDGADAAGQPEEQIASGVNKAQAAAGEHRGGGCSLRQNPRRVQQAHSPDFSMRSMPRHAPQGNSPKIFKQCPSNKPWNT